MPDDIIVCPSCSRKLRMAAIHQGQIVQCPLCSAIFRTPVLAHPPVSSPAPPGGTAPPATSTPPPESIESQTRAAGPGVQPVQPLTPPGEAPQPVVDVQRALLLPGMSLLISGVLSAMFGAYSLRDKVARGPEGMLALLKENLPEEFVRIATDGTSPEQLYQRMLVWNGLALFITLGIIVGAVHILRLQRYRLAMLGSILACVNVVGLGSCCFLTAPLGLWSVMVLRLPEVRSAFDAPPEPESEPSEPE